MLATCLVGAVAIGHLLVAPYTKVEESFSLQACHDLMYLGPHTDQYDHQEYPGVVPRSFIGPMVLSGMAVPFITLFKLLGISKLYSQYIVRLALAWLVVMSWRRFHKQVKSSFGVGVAGWFTAITVTQFHFIYYLSRTLPNTFALVCAVLVFSYWLEQDHWKFVLTSGIGIIIFRIDLIMLLAPMLLHDLYTHRLPLIRLLQWVLTVGAAVLFLTVSIDSLFWGRLLWPEGEVFWFNTALNQSHNWGMLPFLWYWYSALPRALGASYLLVPLGLYVDQRMKLLTAPAFIFVALFSLLPHKELRFIVYALPLFNVAAAAGCHYIWRNKRKNIMWGLLCCGAALHLLVNCTLTALLLTVSANNYPGGVSLMRLHELVPDTQRLSVHIDNLAAQSGVTRFLQFNDNWNYNKTEDLRAGGRDIRSFTHLLVEAKTKYAYNLKHYSESHNIMEAIEAFSHLTFNYQHFPPIKIRTKPALYILENLIDEDIWWTEEVGGETVAIDETPLKSSSGKTKKKQKRPAPGDEQLKTEASVEQNEKVKQKKDTKKTQLKQDDDGDINRSERKPSNSIDDKDKLDKDKQKVKQSKEEKNIKSDSTTEYVKESKEKQDSDGRKHESIDSNNRKQTGSSTDGENSSVKHDKESSEDTKDKSQTKYKKKKKNLQGVEKEVTLENKPKTEKKAATSGRTKSKPEEATRSDTVTLSEEDSTVSSEL
uniref:Mannosyltransferase n=1 Tax=Hirondellea gigas TaxID=1518452 RepID=A0A2P2HXZ8_9CRUS